jgi:hypothetical protein
MRVLVSQHGAVEGGAHPLLQLLVGIHPGMGIGFNRRFESLAGRHCLALGVFHFLAQAILVDTRLGDEIARLRHSRAHLVRGCGSAIQRDRHNRFCAKDLAHGGLDTQQQNSDQQNMTHVRTLSTPVAALKAPLETSVAHQAELALGRLMAQFETAGCRKFDTFSTGCRGQAENQWPA